MTSVGFIRVGWFTMGTTRYYVIFEHDSVSNLITIDDQLDDKFDFTFTYDERNRLLSESAPVMGSGTWTYHRGGTGLVYRVDAPTMVEGQRLTYDSRGNLSELESWPWWSWWIASGKTETYTTDDFGNRSSHSETGTFRYDAGNRLTSVSLLSGKVIDIATSYDGRRTLFGNTRFIYGADRLPLIELVANDEGEVTSARYNVVLGDVLLQTLNPEDATTRYFATDHLGSPILEMGAEYGTSSYRAYSGYRETPPTWVGQFIRFWNRYWLPSKLP